MLDSNTRNWMLAIIRRHEEFAARWRWLLQILEADGHDENHQPSSAL